MERLATLMDEIFSLTISEVAISNMLAHGVNHCWWQRQRVGHQYPRVATGHTGASNYARPVSLQ